MHKPLRTFLKVQVYSYTYLGIDYSQAKFIGDFAHFSDAGKTSMVYIKTEYFGRWNAVVENESEKYDIAGAMRKGNMKYDINQAAKINSKTVVEDMEASYYEELTRNNIEELVKNYSISSKEGIGFIFIAEYLNKTQENACFHFVAFNMNSREVLIHKRYIGVVGGFGLRNYWIRPVYEVIRQISKDYNSWKQEHAN